MSRLFTLRRVLVALPLLLVAAVLLFARFALPGLIHREAIRYVQEHTGHHLAFEVPELHLFGPHLVLRKLRLDEPDGKPLLSFEALEVRLQAWPLLRGRLHFDEIRLGAPHATVTVHPDGRLNWSPFIERLQGPAAQPAAKPREGGTAAVEIATLAVTAAEIDASDERIGLHTRTTPIDLALSNLSTTGDASGQYHLSAVTSLGARVTLEGQAVLKTLSTSGHLQVEGLQLAQLAPLIDAHAPVRIPDGVAGLATQYHAAWQPTRLDLGLTDIEASVKGLVVTQPGAGRPQLKVGTITLGAGQFDLATQQARLGSLRIDGTDLSLPRPGGTPVSLTLGSLALDQVAADLAVHRASAARLTLQDGHAEATRLASGAIDLVEALQSAQGGSGSQAGSASGGAAGIPAAGGGGGSHPAAVAAVAPEHPAPGAGGGADAWHFTLEQLALGGFAARFHDAAVQPQAELAIEGLSASAGGISDDLTRALPVKAAFRISSGGNFTAEGKIVPATVAGDLQFRLAGLELKPAQPYLNQFVRLRLASGTFSTGGQVHLGEASGPRFSGDFELARLRLLEVGSDTLFFGLRAFGTRRLTATPKRVDIPLLTLAGLDTQLKIARDKSINVSRILVTRGAAGAAPATGKPASDPAPAAATPPKPKPARGKTAAVATGPQHKAPAGNVTGAFQADVGQLRISDSALDFADESLALPFGTRIHDLHGVINGLSTRSDARGQVELDGQVDDYGSAHAAGQLDLFDPTGYTDLKVVFRNVEMTRLTPYSATFAGRRINSGKLSLDLAYKVKDRQLAGENQVVMERLTLGERVDSPGATSLPLDLAIAILEDSDGRIDLGLPVSGSLDDPQFSYGRLIWKAIVNVIGKIALAPFRALGALFGGSGDKFESLVFEPGSALPSPPEREKLVKIATALAKRPAISLGVPAAWSEADRGALQDLAVRRAVAARAGQAPAEGEDPGPLALRSPDVQQALEAEFAARLGADTLAGLRKAAPPATDGSLPDSYWQDLSTRLRQATSVTDEALQGLGRQRAAAVVDGLQGAGVAATRLAVGEAAKVDLQDGKIPLKLAPGSVAGGTKADQSATPATAPAPTPTPAAPR